MTRSGRSPLLTAKRVFWACAGVGMPALNPPLILVTGGAVGVILAIAASFYVLWVAAQRAWDDSSERTLHLLWGMLLTAACTVAAGFVEFWILFLILQANCPPDAYECPF
jgi:preprotein translocase subunit Sec61beta